MLARVAARRCPGCATTLVRALSTVPDAAQLPADVERETGLCADGDVRICSSGNKGFGAFAARPMAVGHEVGRYVGEAMALGELMMRYWPGGGESLEGAKLLMEHQAFLADREARGVGMTGKYIFNAGRCPNTYRDIVVDAEDPALANWTRYINHSEKRPNLSAEPEVLRGADAKAPGTPLIRFVVVGPIAEGDELLFDYGDGFELDVLGFEDP